MEMANSIASMATAMSSARTVQNVETAVMKKAMDSQQELANGMLKALDAAAPKFAGENGFLFDAIA